MTDTPKNLKDQRDEISGKKFDDQVFFRLWPYLKPHFALFAFSLVLVFVTAGISLYMPKLLGNIVDRALIPRNLQKLYVFAAWFVGLECVRLILMYFQTFLLQKIGQKVMHGIRGHLFARLIRMPVPFFDKNSVGRLVTRLTNDTANLSELFSAGFVMLLGDLLLIVGVVIAMILLHAKLGLITVSVFPLMILTMVFFSGRLRLAFRRSREVLARLNALFAERMSGMPVIQQFNREKYERESYTKLSREFQQRQFEGVHLYSLFHPAITLLSAASVALVVWYGPKYMAIGELHLGVLVSFFAYVQVLYQPVRNITDRYNVFLAAMSSAERIFTLIDMKPEEGLGVHLDKKSEEMKGSFAFEDVSFSYSGDPEKYALDHISFSVRAGERIALVGHTGAGKTTITSLLLRFYEPSSGRIVLDGKNLSTYTKNELRQRIGFVQQDVFLFTGTIRENLILLSQDVSEKKILEACEATGLASILKRMPLGLDTVLDERGANLSLGERQVIAFTRVFLQQPEILILDEATASVDAETEARIQMASEALLKGRTSLIIAHRLATIRDADRIFVFDKGKLIEAGSHAELVRHGGRYAKLVEAQG